MSTELPVESHSRTATDDEMVALLAWVYPHLPGLHSKSRSELVTMVSMTRRRLTGDPMSAVGEPVQTCTLEQIRRIHDQKRQP